MLTKEELNYWNKTFKDCQINKRDLERPSESFITKALISYLRGLGLKLDLPHSFNVPFAENRKNWRVFEDSLALRVNDILAKANKPYNFTFLDLIKPTSKKTSLVLSALLEYLHYIRMFRSDIPINVTNRQNKEKNSAQSFETVQRSRETQKPEQTREETKETRVSTLIGIQRAKIMKPAEKQKRQMKLLSIKASRTPIQVRPPEILHETLKVEAVEEISELEKLENAVNILIAKLKFLKERRSSLKKQLVFEDEAHESQSILKKLQELIAQRNNLEDAMDKSIKEHRQYTHNLRKLLENAQTIKRSIEIGMWNDLKDINAKLEKINQKEEKLTGEALKSMKSVSLQQQRSKYRRVLSHLGNVITRSSSTIGRRGVFNSNNIG